MRGRRPAPPGPSPISLRAAPRRNIRLSVVRTDSATPAPPAHFITRAPIRHRAPRSALGAPGSPHQSAHEIAEPDLPVALQALDAKYISNLAHAGPQIVIHY